MAAADTAIARPDRGFYCSTSGTWFSDKESLAEHYKSDFHRYNLKRKVAGLPPVTKEWFEARKAQLSSAAAGASAAAPVQKTWVDPLTKKKFATENTYQAFVRSKKYLELVRKSGAPAPEPLIVTRQAEAAEEQKQQPADGNGAPASAAARAAGAFRVVPPAGGLPSTRDKQDGDAAMEGASDGDDDDDGSGWETASDDEVAELASAAAGGGGGGGAAARGRGARAEGEGEWPEWDVCRSLFDNHVSPSFQANLEYMLKNFGFYLPDAQYLKDPEGLLKYLGARLAVGGVPLYARGDEAGGRQFRSLHAVQRHMVDTCQCKLLYDDNEEEYEEFYDYSTQQDDADSDAAAPSSRAVVLAGEGGSGGAGPLPVAVGYELVVGGGGEDGAAGGRVLGHREFARLYRQRHRPEDDRRGVVVNTMLARYRALGAPVSTDAVHARAAKAEAARVHRSQLQHQVKMSLITNTLKKLPKNCEY